VESIFLVESLGLNCLCFVKIDDIPSLILSIVSVPNDYWSSFFILVSINVKTLVFFLEIAEVFISICEELPPVVIGAPDLEVPGFT
jgi:hypothetical protein